LFPTRPHWEVCGEAEDGSEAVKKAAQLYPDLIGMDFRMHGLDGLRAANQIFRSTPSVPIVMYTMYKNEELEATAKLVGIRRAIGKEEGALSLMRAIEAELPAAQA
jgi:DNA-binding NarL/FixJ family response regulator